ncbi:MAG: GNAT family N-acetyltransferase [Pseudomonadota bacterium]|nr:GNAT family N-acetyltransferase [Pseudomonadota bacterium]
MTESPGLDAASATSLGEPVPNWTPRHRPHRTVMEGRFARLEPFEPERHARGLYERFTQDEGGRIWTFLGYGPFDSYEGYEAWASVFCVGDDPMFHTILDARTGAPLGVASYLRIDPANGVIEVGHLCYSPSLQRTPAATEAMYLMARRAFDELGYRRYEWKCNALNATSRRAAERLGFTFEGIFRQHMVVKGHNRDTAWYAMLDREWPVHKAAFEAWLDPANFDAEGRQRAKLEALRGSSGSSP